MRGRWATILIGVWATAVMAAGVTAVVRHTDEVPARTLLARMDDFVAKAPSYRFEGNGESVTVRGSAEGGQRISFAFTLEGAVADGVRRTLITSDDDATEMLENGDRTLIRYAPTPGRLAGARWELAGEPFLPFERSTVGDVFAGGKLSERALEPVVLRRDGGDPVVKFRLAPQPEGEDGPAVESADAELTVTTSGTPRRILVRSTARWEDDDEVTIESTNDYRFSGWGEQESIPLPPDSEIDLTPSIDEEAILAYRDAPLLQPRNIPMGWVFDYGAVLHADETEEGCPQVALDYIDPDDPDAGFLYLYEMPASCVSRAVPSQALTLRAGPYSGWILFELEGTTAQIIAGRTAIQVETDLDQGQLSRVLGELVPLDLSAPPAGIPL